MNPILENRISQKLKHKAEEQSLRTLRLCDPRDPRILNLASNDYLCLSRHPKVIKAAQEALSEFGSSASGSPVVAGYQPLHYILEETLKTWMHFPECMLWSSGFSANHNILSTLPKAGDIVLADRLMHVSALNGILESKARLIRYKHCDIDHLESYLKEHSSSGRLIFVLTESLYSMDSDYPDLKAIATLKEKYPFVWILDEAHAVGWYGPQGQGLAAHFRVENAVDILVATLGKALASQGAFVLLRDPKLKTFLINHSKDFIYTTYPSPANTAAATQAIKIIQSESSLYQKQYHQEAYQLRLKLKTHFPAIAINESPILPLIIGERQKTLQLAENFRKHAGILVGAIRPPSVPEGTSRLRISLNSHIQADALFQRIKPVLENL